MQNLLIRLGACEEVREWVGGRTLSEAWAECERPDWMLWLHARSESVDAAGYAALAGKWAASARAAAKAAEGGKRAEAWAGWAAKATEAAKVARDARFAADGVRFAQVWTMDPWAADESRARQCNDIRAALCCPVFNTPEKGGKDGVR